MRKGSEEMVGRVYSRLTVVSLNGVKESAGARRRYWNCVCECGNEVVVPTNALNTGNTTSCGCVRGERIAKHRMTDSPTYQSWATMIQRCTNPKVAAYSEYGGRGIGVEEGWLLFENFFEDMGERPEGMTLDRIDVNGNYCLHNCQWATRAWQAQNTQHSKSKNSGVGKLPSGRYRTRIIHKGVITNLGTYDSYEEANSIYLKEKQKLLDSLRETETILPLKLRQEEQNDN